MLALVLALVAQAAPTSMLVRPLELGEAVPETRAVALLRVRVEDPAAAETSAELAQKLLAPVRQESFVSFVSMYEKRPTREARGVLGTFSRTMLDPVVAEAVFEGEAVQAGPLEGRDGGVYYVRRIERDAACRQVLVAANDGTARERAEALVRELRAGADFSRVARERSADRASALRGGDLAIFERGRRDVLLRAAAFEARVGEVAGPIETPLGFHVLQRVGVAALSPSLRDDSWARVRAILVAFAGAQGARADIEREHDDAEALANELAARIARGEDMAALAALHDDDRGGRERRGDLGWVRRATTEMPQFFDGLFLQPPGTLIGPVATRLGFVLLRREDSGLRSRVEVRRSPLAELVQSLDVRASDGPASPAAATALAAWRVLAEDPTLRVELEAALPRLSSAADLEAWCALQPESRRPPALEVARTLAALEPEFLAERWPESARRIDAAMAELRERQVALFDAAFDVSLRELRLSDPRGVVRFGLVTRAAPTERGSTPRFLALGDVATMFDELLASTVLASTAGGNESTPVIAALRSAYGPRATLAIEALVRAQSASVVRRAFAPDYRGHSAADALAERLGALWLGHVERGEPLDATLKALSALAR